MRGESCGQFSFHVFSFHYRECAVCPGLGDKEHDIVLVGKVWRQSEGDFHACKCCKAINRGGECVLREGGVGQQGNCRLWVVTEVSKGPDSKYFHLCSNYSSLSLQRGSTLFLKTENLTTCSLLIPELEWKIHEGYTLILSSEPCAHIVDTE